MGGTVHHQDIMRATSLSDINIDEKIGGIKGDYMVRPGVIAGFTVGTDGTAAVRVGLGMTSHNVYLEPSVKVHYVETSAVDRLRYQTEFNSADARGKVAREAVASNNEVTSLLIFTQN
jgi:hypothetical protein